MLKILVLLLALTACVHPPARDLHPMMWQGHNFHWSSWVEEMQGACGEFFKKHKVEATEQDWFLCMHALGTTF